MSNLLTRKEAAARLGIGLVTLDEERAAGRLGYIQRAPGCKVYIREEDITEDLVYTIRGALMALPGRLAVDVSACNTPAEASDVIRREVNKVMRELSRYHYDPKKYEERVRERRNWSEHDADEDY